MPDYISIRQKIITNEPKQQVKYLYDKIMSLKASASASQFDDWFKGQCLTRSKLKAQSSKLKAKSKKLFEFTGKSDAVLCRYF